MNLKNPYTDPKFANLQLVSKKARAVIELSKGHYCFVFSVFKGFTMLYATNYSRKLNRIAKQYNAIYVLIESYEKLACSTENPIKQIVPRYTTVIDLKQSLEDILHKMHPKGRYNIRLANKKGVEIKQVFNTNDFYEILKETAKRDGFNLNSADYYQSFLATQNAKLFMAYFNGRPIAGILNLYIQKTAIYFYGASSNQYRNLMAPYALQWYAIEDAKESGYEVYDLFGTANPTSKKDRLHGVTYFKQKFGGETVMHPKSRVIVYNYFLYFGLKIRSWLKNFFY